MRQSDRLGIAPGDADRLNERTEGWVAGLQLVGYVLRGQTPDRIGRFAAEFSGSVRSIETYLWEEVIGRQKEAVRAFLLQSSILDRFTGPLCLAVTGNDDSAAIIRQLERDRLFVVALDDRGQWYRYHHLFADALRDRLTQEVSEAGVADLHRRASAWLERHELIEEASRHALAGRDWERCDRLLERISIEHYAVDRLASLCSLLQGVPPEVLERSPTLAFRLAWALIRSGNFQQAEQPLRLVEQAWAAAGDQADTASLLILQAFRSMYDSATRVIELCVRALALLTDDRPIDQGNAYALLGWAHTYAGDASAAERAFAGARAKANVAANTWIRLSELAGSAGVLIQRGKLLEAIALYQRAIKLDDRYASTLLGLVLIERNQLDEAERHLRSAFTTYAQPRSMIVQSRIRLGLAQLAWARGDVETANDEIERAIDHARQLGSTRYVRHCRAQQARFWVAADQREQARRWAASCDLDPYLPPDYERFFEHLTVVRLLIADDQADSALKILEAIGEQAVAQDRTGDLVEVLVLRAMANQREGRLVEAGDALGRALALGEAGGYVRLFVNEGEAIVPLLRRASTFGAHSGYAQALLAATEGAVALATRAKPDNVDSLSKREIEVLRLAAAGLRNRDIGRHLFISEMTVKRHLSTIYEKLGVNSRTQAIDHARRSGVL
jgi:LuxR family maltose regulon positive regulatory protein